MTWADGLLGFAAGLLISVVTAPVGVSGAVFLLPVQVSLLGVPSPAVTPTNLLYNVVAGPGALLRHRGSGQLRGPLTRLLVAGAVPGVVAGAAVRVYAVPGPVVFRLFVAALLLPLGVWLCARTLRPARPAVAPTTPAGRPPSGSGGEPSPRATTFLAAAVGVVGGIYGIGGGSLLGPLLVGRGMPVARVAPAALACTFVTSVVGAAAYALLALTTPGSVAPDWFLGVACGLGGLAGGYLGARLQPRLPETGLRLLLGVMAVGTGLLYAVQALR
ncbi:sulfite exporter TauE/SafE family protein [Streptomyces genisteinicus]|uniref:Probable membrane transporter protein n=1 Tax=Streptomyces genisteinicus TaxID=2768068 RepID=A0A7H0HRE0_9ACTN|nr:sulfite exporter TauE/SafE family protein [Streptomyces genisteinicus]QNP63106.1 sulfite exporter TauE/SafE family protein [Streptomyces genisteinicus]